jgi:hypothetical protein
MRNVCTDPEFGTIMLSLHDNLFVKDLIFAHPIRIHKLASQA